MFEERLNTGEFGCKNCKRLIEYECIGEYYIVYCDYGPNQCSKVHLTTLEFGCIDWADKMEN